MSLFLPHTFYQISLKYSQQSNINFLLDWELRVRYNFDFSKETQFRSPNTYALIMVHAVRVEKLLAFLTHPKRYIITTAIKSVVNLCPV